MTMFIQLENGSPIGHAIVEENLRMLFPDLAFPNLFTPAFVEPLGFGIYEWTAAPIPAKFQKVVEIAPTKRDNGIYYQTWSVVDMTTEEQQEATTKQETIIRGQRNFVLLKCDWTQLPDSTVDKGVWATYRQALRDVPTQAGFPWEVTWPTTP